MRDFRLIGVAVLSLMLASPAMAMHRSYHHHYAHVHKTWPLRDAFGYSPGYGGSEVNSHWVADPHPVGTGN
jgi:hypothetical protein